MKKGVVVGGGYIGLEMAEALVRQGLEVSLVDRSNQVMGSLDEDMGGLVSQALRNLGVTLYLEEALKEFQTTAGKVTGIVTDQRTLPADIVILGLGVRPNTALAAAAGIPLGEKGARGQRTDGNRNCRYMGRRRLCRVVPSGEPQTGLHNARHGRQSPWAGSGHQSGRRVRHLPRGRWSSRN